MRPGQGQGTRNPKTHLGKLYELPVPGGRTHPPGRQGAPVKKAGQHAGLGRAEHPEPKAQTRKTAPRRRQGAPVCDGITGRAARARRTAQCGTKARPLGTAERKSARNSQHKSKAACPYMHQYYNISRHAACPKRTPHGKTATGYCQRITARHASETMLPLSPPATDK